MGDERGMDPFSYGINNATNATEYKNGTTIIQTLVDVVGKNGNYLLDVGPTSEGDIIAPMADNLLAAGRWLKYAGKCVYATDYWYPASQDPTGSYRFLTTPETFCIVAFNKPIHGSVVVDAGGVVLPIQKGDTITLLAPTNGTTTAGQDLEWSIDENGVLTIDVPQRRLGIPGLVCNLMVVTTYRTRMMVSLGTSAALALPEHFETECPKTSSKRRSDSDGL
ncbi:alpha-L-fucosidase-domain-containing protein [Butyriboletus roseoflavus]|nr:alpha-L-fucosidase-domain-containing protein [Butyriboletus roseoflavus]